MFNPGLEQLGDNETSPLAARNRVGTPCDLLPVSMLSSLPPAPSSCLSPLELLVLIGPLWPEWTAHGLKPESRDGGEEEGVQCLSAYA